MTSSPRRPARRVTLWDVAAKAQVSIATVSRVLNGSRPVDPEIAEHVRQLSERMGYRANAAARALRTDRTATVGMVVPHISNPYFPQIVESVERELYRSGHDLLLCDSLGDPTVEHQRIQALVNGRVDALIFVPADEELSYESVRFAADHVPVVMLDRKVNHDRAAFVGVDNRAGVEMLVSHVRAAGAVHCMLITGEGTSSATRQRTDAFLEFTHDMRRKVLAGGEISVECGRWAVRRIWRTKTRPDALLCAADIIAVGAVAELRRLGARVPDDVIVTGFDDIAIASAVIPTLTTVRQPFQRMAEAAVEIVTAGDKRPSTAPRDLVLRPTLVVRESSSRDCNNA